jgi:hypothetical protein
VGAPHIRDRFFLLAADPNRYPVREFTERHQRGERRQPEAECGNVEPVHAGGPGAPADADGIGRADVREQRGLVGEQSLGGDADGRDSAVANANRPRLSKRGRQRANDGASGSQRPGLATERDHGERGRGTPAVTGVRGSNDGPPVGLVEHPWLAGVPSTFERPHELERDWGERIHALGNSVVPAAAAAAWGVLWSRLMGDREVAS